MESLFFLSFTYEFPPRKATLRSSGRVDAAGKRGVAELMKLGREVLVFDMLGEK